MANQGNTLGNGTFHSNRHPSWRQTSSSKEIKSSYLPHRFISFFGSSPVRQSINQPVFQPVISSEQDHSRSCPSKTGTLGLGLSDNVQRHHHPRQLYESHYRYFSSVTMGWGPGQVRRVIVILGFQCVKGWRAIMHSHEPVFSQSHLPLFRSAYLHA